MTDAVLSARRADAVLFDIDDTLVDTRGAFAAALAVVARTYLPHLGQERYDDVLSTWRADHGGHYARYTRGETAYEDQRRARAEELQATFGGAPLGAEGYRSWNDAFEAGFAAAWTAHHDAHDVVARLLAGGLAVGALSNAAVAYQTTKLERVGLADDVPVLVGVDTLGVGKPDPRVFAEACRRLGSDPARTAYVGDELDVDAVAAVQVGMLGIWVDRPGPRRVDVPNEDIAAARAVGVEVVTSLTELPSVLGLP